MGPNGSHESLLPSSDIESDISVTECPYCFTSTEEGCDCHLDEEEEKEETSSDYETSSENECEENTYYFEDPGVRRFQYNP